MLTRLLLTVVFLTPVVWGLVDVVRRPKVAAALSSSTPSDER